MTADEADRAAACEDLCRFLSACYYEPAQEFAQEQLFDSMLAAAERLDPTLAGSVRRLGEAFGAQDLQTLLVDYARLFVGPAHPMAPPYGSFWLGTDTAAEPDAALGLVELYRQGGFEIDAGFPELPDHVAVELEFLYLLAFTQSQARRSGDDDAVTTAQALQKRLLDEHLGRWMAPFAAAIQAGAETAFYRELAALSERFVRTMAGAPLHH